jgi:hypothetical protein
MHFAESQASCWLGSLHVSHTERRHQVNRGSHHLSHTTLRIDSAALCLRKPSRLAYAALLHHNQQMIQSYRRGDAKKSDEPALIPTLALACEWFEISMSVFVAYSAAWLEEFLWTLGTLIFRFLLPGCLIWAFYIQLSSVN